MTNSVGPEIAGALARFWAGGSGPTHASINSAFALAGYEESPSDDNKQQRVLNAIRHADDDTAKLIVEELLNVLRSGGYFDPPGDFSVEDPKVESLRAAFKRRGYNLTEGGYADWSPQDQRQAPPPKTQAAVAAVASPEKVAPEVVTIPTVGLLVRRRFAPLGLVWQDPGP